MTLAFLAQQAFVSNGAAVGGVQSVTLAYPSGANEGVIAVACVDSGHPTAGIVPSTPDGWSRVGTFEGGGGVYGVDAGPRTITVFIRQLQSNADDEPTFTIPEGTESRCGGAITLLSRAAGETVRYALSTGADTSSGTGFSVTGGTALSWAVDDFAWLAYVVNTDTTFSSEGVAAAGITFSAVTERADNISTIGADVGRAVATASVTAGTGSVAPTITATLAGAATGVAACLRLRDEAEDAGPGTVTLTYDDTLARVGIVLAGFDTHATKATVERSPDGIRWTTVRGSVDAAVTAGALVVPLWDYEFTPGVVNTYRVTAYDDGLVVSDVESATITPELTQIWLKSIKRPFLNRAVQMVLLPDTRIGRPARTSVNAVKGRTNPVAVNDIRGSRRWTALARTETIPDAVTMDYVLAAGDVMLIQVPYGCTSVPAGYVTIGDTEESYHPLRVARRTFILPCVEVAPPGPYVVPATATWDSVIALYGNWDAVIAANLTWSDLLELIGDPSEVIVP